MKRKTTEEFFDDLTDFDICMLATRDGRHLRSRPMKPYFDNPDGSIRFLTSVATHKVDELESSPEANAAFSEDDDLFISVSGKVRLSRDPADIEALWSAEAEPWLEKSETVVLILDPEIAEYWDSSANSVKAGWEMIKGAVTGREPEVGSHGKLQI